MITQEEIQTSIEISREKYNRRKEQQEKRIKEEKGLLKLLREKTILIKESEFIGGTDFRLVTFAFGLPEPYTAESITLFSVWWTVKNPKDKFDRREAKLSLARKIKNDSEGQFFILLTNKNINKSNMLYSAKRILQLATLEGSSRLNQSTEQIVLESIQRECL